MKKREYCVYFSEIKEQFAFTTIERAKKYELQIVTNYLKEDQAKQEASDRNRCIDNWLEHVKER